MGFLAARHAAEARHQAGINAPRSLQPITPVPRNGQLTRVDEIAMLDELRSYLPEFQKHHSQVESINREFEPYFAKIHRRCCELDVGINRYSSTEREWRW